jgi:hypothetical protein
MDMHATSEQVNGTRNPEVQHERSDVSVFGIVTFGAVLLASALIIYVGMGVLFNYFGTQATQTGRPLPPVAPATGERMPPEPRLQVSPSADLQTMRAAEDAILNNYGWVDRQAGAVRIPVEQAMHILVQRGLPVQQDEKEH